MVQLPEGSAAPDSPPVEGPAPAPAPEPEPAPSAPAARFRESRRQREAATCSRCSKVKPIHADERCGACDWKSVPGDKVFPRALAARKVRPMREPRREPRQRRRRVPVSRKAEWVLVTLKEIEAFREAQGLAIREFCDGIGITAQN